MAYKEAMGGSAHKDDNWKMQRKYNFRTEKSMRTI